MKLKLKTIFPFVLSVVMCLNCLEGAKQAVSNEVMKILVKKPKGETILIQTAPNATIQKIKSKIKEKTGIATEEQILMFGGAEIEDLRNLSDYNDIQELSSINLSTRLRGTNILDSKEAIDKGFNTNNEVVKIQSFHVSCKSDKWHPNQNYGGIILYQYYGKIKWKYNNIRCKSGYIIIKEVDKIKNIKESSGAQIHGKVYKSVFGKDFSRNRIQASGFSYDGKKKIWKYRSWTCNSPNRKYDAYHDDKKEMNDQEKNALQQTINNWIKTGEQNYDVSGYNLSLYKDKSYKDPNDWCLIQ